MRDYPYFVSYLPKADLQLAYSVFGDPSAPADRLLIHHHGTPSSRLEAWVWSDVARQLRLKLVAVDRPGFGRTPFTPVCGAADLALWAAAIDELATDVLGASHYAVSGESSGAVFAAACAHYLAPSPPPSALMESLAMVSSRGGGGGVAAAAALQQQQQQQQPVSSPEAEHGTRRMAAGEPSEAAPEPSVVDDQQQGVETLLSSTPPPLSDGRHAAADAAAAAGLVEGSSLGAAAAEASPYSPPRQGTGGLKCVCLVCPQCPSQGWSLGNGSVITAASAVGLRRLLHAWAAAAWLLSVLTFPLFFLSRWLLLGLYWAFAPHFYKVDALTWLMWGSPFRRPADKDACRLQPWAAARITAASVECFRQGLLGALFESTLLYLADWGFDAAGGEVVSSTACRVLVWYGGDDVDVPPAHVEGTYLRALPPPQASTRSRTSSLLGGSSHCLPAAAPLLPPTGGSAPPGAAGYNHQTTTASGAAADDAAARLSSGSPPTAAGLRGRQAAVQFMAPEAHFKPREGHFSLPTRCAREVLSAIDRALREAVEAQLQPRAPCQ